MCVCVCVFEFLSFRMGVQSVKGPFQMVVVWGLGYRLVDSRVADANPQLRC